MSKYADYIREYLDPAGTLDDSPTTADEARALWASLEETFAEDSGTGMAEEDFVAAVTEMQSRFSRAADA